MLAINDMAEQLEVYQERIQERDSYEDRSRDCSKSQRSRRSKNETVKESLAKPKPTMQWGRAWSEPVDMPKDGPFGEHHQVLTRENRPHGTSPARLLKNK